MLSINFTPENAESFRKSITIPKADNNRQVATERNANGKFFFTAAEERKNK
jgi:hypothetical protein